MSEMSKCEYCQNDKKGYVLINPSWKYSGIMISINSELKFLRALYCGQSGSIEDTAHINYCPMCGRKLESRNHEIKI